MEITNSQRELKYEILANGIQVSIKAKEVWQERFCGPLTLAEYASTSGIALHTENGMWLNAPFLEKFAIDNAKIVLDYVDDKFVLVWRGEHTMVIPTPVPAYHQETYEDGDKRHPYTRVGVTHTDRCRVSPVEGCAWICTFCNLPYDFRYTKKRCEEMLEVIRLATRDSLSPARHVLISGGTPRPEDEKWIDEIYVQLAQESPIPVDVMMPARRDMEYPRVLKEGGVNLLSVNLEIWDEAKAMKITPHKARLLGRAHYLDYIERAVEIMGVGFVQSLMVFGSAIEPIENTLEAVEALAKRGCMPVLSPFRPDDTTPLGKSGAVPASIEEMRSVYEKSLELCSKHGGGVKLGPRCVPCMHNTITFPSGSGFYCTEEDDLTKSLVL